MAFSSEHFFLPFFINFNFNKAKLIVCKMKKQILQQSYPSDNSSQFATEFPLASATEWGLYFFSEYFFNPFLPSLPPYLSPWETDYIKKHCKINNCLDGEMCCFFPPLFYILISDPYLDPTVSDRNIDISWRKIRFLYTGDESCKLCCVDRTRSRAGGSFWWSKEGLNTSPSSL